MSDPSCLAQATQAPINAGDTAWMLVASSLVFLMTPALAFFYGGMSRQKSVLNMMMMSFGALGVVGIVYVLWGYSMSFGPRDLGGVVASPWDDLGLRGVIGDAQNWTVSVKGEYPQLLDVAFQLTCAAIAVALISGAVAERVRFSTWLLFSALWATFAYFPLAHMVWGGGLLSNAPTSLAAHLFGTADGKAAVAPVDFAGGTVVHVSAGAAGLVLAVLVGKRLGFGATAFRPHSMPFVMLGAALLWFGWFGFNAGSAYGASGMAALAWLNSTVAACSGMVGWLLVERLRDGHATSLGTASGIVAGLVAITPAAGAVSPLGSLAIGAVAGGMCALAVRLKFRLGLDDSLDVAGLHLVAAVWGTVAVGFFATGTFATSPGLLYSWQGWKLLVVQVVISVIVLVFAGVVTLLVGLVCALLGWRVDTQHEHTGIDSVIHAETAYDFGLGAHRRFFEGSDDA